MELLGIILLALGIFLVMVGIISAFAEEEALYLLIALLGILPLFVGAGILGCCENCCPKCDAIIECYEQTHCSECGHLINEDAAKKEKVCEHNINIDVNCNCKEVAGANPEATTSVDTEKDASINSEPTTETEVDKTNNKNFCGNCGDKIVKNNKYCSNCGSKY